MEGAHPRDGLGLLSSAPPIKGSWPVACVCFSISAEQHGPVAKAKDTELTLAIASLVSWISQSNFKSCRLLSKGANKLDTKLLVLVYLPQRRHLGTWPLDIRHAVHDLADTFLQLFQRRRCKPPGQAGKPWGTRVDFACGKVGLQFVIWQGLCKKLCCHLHSLRHFDCISPSSFGFQPNHLAKETKGGAVSVWAKCKTKDKSSLQMKPNWT